jgi:digeranylgeranylglycerophospholipid reductase
LLKYQYFLFRIGTVLEKREIVIVGGGVAGLSLARSLAEKGVDFTLLEEHPKFYMKVCGEGVSTDHRFSIHDLYRSSVGFENKIIGAVLHFPYSKIVKHTGAGYTINKEAFEVELNRQVEVLGGEVRMGERVTALERKGNSILVHPQEILCRCIIGCDGVFSIVRRFFKQSLGRVAFALSGEVEKDDEDHVIKFFFDRQIVPGGYAWSFPKDKTYNVGLGSLYEATDGKRCLMFLKKKWGAERIRGAYIPLYLPSKTFFKGGILIGDAAPQINYLTGGGINSSIACAQIAGDVLAEIHKRKKEYSEKNLKEYEKRWKRALRWIRLQYLTSIFAYRRMARSDAYSLMFSVLYPFFASSLYFK